MATLSYLEKFNTNVEMIKVCGGFFWYNKEMLKTQLVLTTFPLDISNTNIDEIDVTTEDARGKYLAADFLSGSDVI